MSLFSRDDKLLDGAGNLTQQAIDLQMRLNRLFEGERREMTIDGRGWKL
jgi:hypothetical protein